MLMAAAQVLSGMEAELPGTVMFLFQPAEEGPSNLALSPEATWGARMMLEEGVFKQLKPDAVSGLHVMPGHPGTLYWREGATTASSDTLPVTVNGRQGHGGMPWDTEGVRKRIGEAPIYPTTVNDPALTARMAPALSRAADGKVEISPLRGASEDFSYFAQQVPGLYVFLGITPPDQDPAKAAPNHNPAFFVYEPALEIGARTMATLAVDFLAKPPAGR